jgi:hypothetical protein
MDDPPPPHAPKSHLLLEARGFRVVFRLRNLRNKMRHIGKRMESATLP